MNDVYSFTAGNTPILVSMPHSGTLLPDDIYSRLSQDAKSLPDTDWHIPRLYDFIFKKGHSVLQANYSRYVVDLNRPPTNESLYPGQPGTGLCPETLFNGQALYASGKTLEDSEIKARRSKYWQPYHDRLSQALMEIKTRFGYAILYDAHSIASRVPRLFEGRLPDLNLGTLNGESCSPEIQLAVINQLKNSNYHAVVNERFLGGYITRHYGNPDNNIHALQMEIAQCTYMSEIGNNKYNEIDAANLQLVLKQVFKSLEIAY